VRKVAEPSVVMLALKLVTVKPKVSPASVVEKSWIAGGTLFPIIKGMVPEAKVIGLPSVKYVAKVPPIAPPITEPGSNVRVRAGVVVKISPPLDESLEKKPVMESARAAAVVLIAKAATMIQRFIIGPSWIGFKD
jgi:hypothetical protein